MKTIENGDYVLATKYSDGDPLDQWCIGFYDKTIEGPGGGIRHLVVDSNGAQFRHNGFRRVKKIRADVGASMLDKINYIQSSSRSLWSHELYTRKHLNQKAKS